MPHSISLDLGPVDMLPKLELSPLLSPVLNTIQDRFYIFVPTHVQCIHIIFLDFFNQRFSESTIFFWLFCALMVFVLKDD